MKRIDRATLRGKPLDDGCKKAVTTTGEYGKEDKRVYCYGLIRGIYDDVCKECRECKAYVYNATPLSKEINNENS